MTTLRCLLLIGLAGLAGCRDADGVFEPSCVAYAGETVTLRDGRFEWDRFTDERRLRPDGSVVDPFPGFPRHGDFTIDGRRVTFAADDGEPLDDRFLVSRGDDLYLVDAGEFDALERGGPLPDCPLKRRVPSP